MSRNIPAKLQKLLRALDDEERRVVRETIGIDVDTWRVDERVFGEHKRRIEEYRELVAKQGGTPSPEAVATYNERQCTGCGKRGSEVYFLVTLVHGTTMCERCLELLEGYAQEGA
jgi:hypothetical protein